MMSQHNFTPVELHFVCYNCHMINCLFCQQQTVNLIASHNFQGFSNIRFWQLPTFGTLPWTSSYWFHHLESLLCHLTAFTDNLSSEISPPTSVCCSVRFHFSFLTTQKQIRLRWITKTRSSLVLHQKCGCWCCLVCKYRIDIRKVVLRISPSSRLLWYSNQSWMAQWKLKTLASLPFPVFQRTLPITNIHYVYSWILNIFRSQPGGLWQEAARVKTSIKAPGCQRSGIIIREGIISYTALSQRRICSREQYLGNICVCIKNILTGW